MASEIILRNFLVHHFIPLIYFGKAKSYETDFMDFDVGNKNPKQKRKSNEN